MMSIHCFYLLMFNYYYKSLMLLNPVELILKKMFSCSVIYKYVKKYIGLCSEGCCKIIYYL